MTLQPDKRLLKSSCGMDYSKLRELLATEEWEEADEETGRLILAVSSQKMAGLLSAKVLDNFPSIDLRTIDQLWVRFSDGRFGFSVQKQIYQSLGGTRNYDSQIWSTFGEQVGWRNKGSWLYYQDITFNINAPLAHLPCVFLCNWDWDGMRWHCCVGEEWGDCMAIFLSRQDL